MTAGLRVYPAEQVHAALPWPSLVARDLARADATDLLVVGTGRLAPYMVRARCALRAAPGAAARAPVGSLRRAGAEELTLFKSVGSALADLAAAEWVVAG